MSKTLKSLLAFFIVVYAHLAFVSIGNADEQYLTRSDLNLTSFLAFNDSVETVVYDRFNIDKNVNTKFQIPSKKILLEFEQQLNAITDSKSLLPNSLISTYQKLLDQNPKYIFHIYQIAKSRAYALEGSFALNLISEIELILVEQVGSLNNIKIATDSLSKRTLVQLGSVYQKISSDLQVDMANGAEKFSQLTGYGISSKQFSWLVAGISAAGIYYAVDELLDEGCTAPVVNLSINSTSISEASGTATITATILNAASTSITIPLVSSGTATSGTDYAAISNITIASGSTTGTATFTPVNDTHYDASSNENATFTIGTNGQGYCFGETRAVTVAIVDDESAPTLSLASSAASIAEDAGSSITLTATLSVATYETVTVALTPTGTATEGNDFSTIPDITISPGSTSGTTSFTPTNDTMYETATAETAIIAVTGVTGGSASESGTQSKTIAITADNDPAPTVTLASSASSVGEAGSDLTLTATLSNPTYQTVTVSIDGTGGSATEGTDFATVTDITIASGDTTGTAAFNPTVDSLYDATSAESAVIAISGVTGGAATESGTQTTSISITDGDSAPTVTIASSASTVGEGDSDLTLTATLSVATYANVTVSLGTSGTATSGSDYTAVASTVTITAGSTTGTTTLNPTDDSGTYEDTETVIVSITGVSGGSASESGAQTTTVSITENESAPTVTLATSASSVSEGGSNLTLTATLSISTYEAVTITLDPTGTGTEGTDYATISNITISAGATTGTAVFNPTDDSKYESSTNETAIVAVTGVSGGGASESGTQSQTITITENDSAPTVTLATSATTLDENSNSAITITATLSNTTYETVTVALTPSGTADEGTDYPTISDITITEDATTGTASFTTTDDCLLEGDTDETVVVAITGVSGGSATESGTPQSVALAIDDDEGNPKVTLASSASSITEGTGSITLTASIGSCTYEQNIVVSLGVAGTGTEGTDYNDIPSTITIVAGNTGITQAFTPVDDNLYDATSNETAIISITGVSGGTASEQGTQSETLTIVDAQSAPTVTLASSASSVSEDASDLTLTATLSTATYAAVTVTIDDTGGTGTVDTDFAEVSDITISAGSTTGTTAFNPTPDAHYDATSAETGVIAISGVSGGSATESGTQVATISIIDAESAPTLSIATNDTSLGEGDSDATLTATLSPNATYAAVTVSIDTSGTATEGDDYANMSNITIAAGSTSGTAAFNPTQDSLYEQYSSETAIINVGVSGGSATENGTQTLTYTITEGDSAPTVTLSSSASTVYDNASNLTVTATLSVATYETVTVGISTSGTATETSDYATVSDITVSAGSTSGTTSFNPTADSTYEGTETATLAISTVNGGGASENSTPQTASITITEYALRLATTFTDSGTANTIKSQTSFTNIDSSSADSTINAYELINLHKIQAFTDGTDYLTGKGETIHIADFYCETGHDAFDNKSVWTYGNFNADTASNYHCNYVASIAAGYEGNSHANQIRGVAYDANIVFSSIPVYTGDYRGDDRAAALDFARGKNAVASNQSWVLGDNTDGNANANYNLTEYNTLASNNPSYNAYQLLGYLTEGNASAPSAQTAAATAWITAMNDFQTAGGVMVFAAGNYTGESDVSLLAGLPEVFSQLSEAWLAVGFIDTSGSSILSTSNVSQGGNKCGSAKEYCLVTDGSDLRGAQYVNGSGTSIYLDGGSGSSYSSPMVTGAIALLNQAFPNHTAEAIVDRLLASANNTWFSPEGNTTFTTHGSSITHGYHSTWGHGIPDLYAALSPITSNGNPASASGLSGSSSSSSNSSSSSSPALALYVSNNLNDQSGRLSLTQSGLITSSSFGSAFAAGLSNEIGYFYDILNGGFRFNFSNLFQETSPKHIDMINALVADINRLSFSLDIDDTKNYSYSFSNVFGKVGNKEAGQLGFSLESTSAPIRHFNQINNGSSFYLASFENPFTDNSKIGFGINAQYQFDDTAILIGYHNNEIRLSNNLEDIDQVETFAISFTQQNDYFDNITILTGLMVEEDTLLDSKGSGALGFHGTNPHSLFAGVNFEKIISNDLSVKFVSTFGYSTLDTPVHSLIGEVSPITSTSFNLILNKYGIMHDSDRLSVSIGQPNRVETGTMTFRIPELADSEGNLTYANREIDLKPSGRQIDFGIDYVTKLDNDLILGVKHTMSKDFNHIESSALNNTVTFTAKIDF